MTKEVRFKIGDAFPSEDPVAAWITGLAIIHNDIVAANIALSAAFEADGEAVSPTGLYHFRLAVAHYREACKFLHRGAKDPAVATFLDALGAEAKDCYDRVRRTYTPWAGSFVEAKLKPARDMIFHYPELSGEELQAALEAKGDMESNITAKDDNLRGMRMLWADEVAMHLAFGHLENLAEVRIVFSQLRDAMLALIGFSQRAIAAYFVGLPAGTFDVHEI